MEFLNIPQAFLGNPYEFIGNHQKILRNPFMNIFKYSLGIHWKSLRTHGGSPGHLEESLRIPQEILRNPDWNSSRIHWKSLGIQKNPQEFLKNSLEFLKNSLNSLGSLEDFLGIPIYIFRILQKSLGIHAESLGNPKEMPQDFIGIPKY